MMIGASSMDLLKNNKHKGRVHQPPLPLCLFELNSIAVLLLNKLHTPLITIATHDLKDVNA
jgi:hypothetical protein